MPIHFEIDPRHGYVWTEVSDTVELADVMEYVRALRAHPEYDPALPRLIDLRRLRNLGLTSRELRAVVDAVRQESEPVRGRRALVAGSDFIFGMLRMFSLLADSGAGTYEAFRTIEAAQQWLGITLRPPGPQDHTGG